TFNSHGLLNKILYIANPDGRNSGSVNVIFKTSSYKKRIHAGEQKFILRVNHEAVSNRIFQRYARMQSLALNIKCTWLLVAVVTLNRERHSVSCNYSYSGTRLIVGCI